LRRFERDALAALYGMIVGPQQVSSYAAPWPPDFGDFGELLRVGSFAQAECNARRFLQGEVARRPCVGVPEAKQKINVRRPRPDTMHLRQPFVRDIRVELADCVEIDLALADRLADLLQRFDFRR